MEKKYDRAALIQAYIASKEPGHDDIKRFNAERLAALEQAFDVRLHWEGVKNRDNSELWMLFQATVRSYMSISTPRSGFLDDSLINIKLDRLGEQAESIKTCEALIHRAAETSREAHIIMLDELFKLLWGEIDTVVTSNHLRKLGFDDSHEPKWWDYE